MFCYEDVVKIGKEEYFASYIVVKDYTMGAEEVFFYAELKELYDSSGNEFTEQSCYELWAQVEQILTERVELERM